MSGKIIYNGKEYTGEVLNSTGVGEFTTNEGKKNPTGVNSERFNDYVNNTATGQYSHTEGYSNVNGADKTLVGGESNSISKGTDSIIYGKTIKTDSELKANPSVDYSIISGYNHTLGRINCTEVSGLNNTVTGADYSIIGGQDHTIGSLNSSLVTGVRHTIVDAGNYDSCTGNIVGGYENYLEGDYSLLTGRQNKMWNPEQSVSELQGNFISGYYNQAWGSYNSITGMGLITLGNAAHAEGYGTAGNKNYSDVRDVVEAIGAYPKGSGSTWINQWLTDFDDYCSEQGITDDAKTDLLLRCKLVAEGGSQSVSQIIPITGGYQAQISSNYRGIAIGIGAHVEGEYCNAHGYGAHAEGMWGVALSSASHAEGFITVAYGQGSHVEGKYNQIGIGLQDNWKLSYALYNSVDSTKTWNANCAHVEGQYNVVTTGSGTFAHLEGYANGVVNSADYAHIEGGQNTAINPGPSIHIEGNSNLVYGKSSSEGSAYSHIEGGYNMMAKSPYSHTEGYGSRLYSSTASHLESYYGFIYDSNYSHLENSGIFSVSNFDQIIGSKAETSDAYRLASYFDILQDPSRANRHMGSDTDTLDNSIISSNCSHAEGNCVIIYSSPNSHIEGTSIADTTNKILYRHSIDGYSYGSHAEGGGNYITEGSIYSHIEGYLNQINSGSGYSHVEGAENYLTNGSSYSHIEGYRVYVGGSAYATHVEGTGIRIKDFTIPNIDITTELQNQRNNVIENRTILTDKVVWTYEHCVHAACSHLEGFKNLIGMGATISHVEGTYNCVSGSLVNHIEGVANCVTSGALSCHVEGQNNIITSGPVTGHIEGGYNILSYGGLYNHAEGYNNIITYGTSQCHIEGTYNVIQSTSDYSHVEGRGNALSGSSKGTHIEGLGNIADIQSMGYENLINKISPITGTFTSPDGKNTLQLCVVSEGNKYCHVEGIGNTVQNGMNVLDASLQTSTSPLSGCGMHIEGILNKLKGTGGHAEGTGNIGKDLSGGHIEGYLNMFEAYGGYYYNNIMYNSQGSHIEGLLNNAYGGVGVHVEGMQNNAKSGYISHLEGFNNTIEGWNALPNDETTGLTQEQSQSVAAHGEGTQVTVRGFAAHAQNEGTITNAQAQTAMGRFNIEDLSTTNANPYGTYAVMVGNGSGELTTVTANTYDADEGVYAIGDYCIYASNIYQCKEAITVAEAFDGTKWQRIDGIIDTENDTVQVRTRSNAATLTWDGYLDVSGGFSVNGTPIGGTSGDIANPNISDEYSSFSTYNVGDYCIYNNVLYKCNTAITVGETFDSTKWIATTIGSELLAIIRRVSTLETALNGYSFANTMTKAEYDQITPDTNTIYPVVEE